MNEKEKQKKKKYCEVCGIVEGAEPLGVKCDHPECPRKFSREDNE
jgi:hypothetical protein